MHIHARAVTYFDMIRRCGSIREAARRLHVASSAVNRQLLQIEEEVGVPLFERLSTGLKLTAAGEVFSRHVITVLQDERRMVGELDMIRGISGGALSVSSVEGLNADLMPACLEQMSQRFPNIRIDVRPTGSAQAANAVTNGEADVVIGFSLERYEGLRQCAIGRFSLGAVVHVDHPIAALTTVCFSECTKYPLILPTPEISIRAILKPVIAQYKNAFTVILETTSIELAKTFAGRGLGVAFQSRLGLERELAEKKLAYVPLRSPEHLLSDLGVYVRASRNPPPALEAFIRIVAEEIKRREDEEA